MTGGWWWRSTTRWWQYIPAGTGPPSQSWATSTTQAAPHQQAAIAWVAPRRIRHILDNVEGLPYVAKYHLNGLVHSPHNKPQDLTTYDIVIVEVPCQINDTTFVAKLLQLVNHIVSAKTEVIVISEPSIRGRSGLCTNLGQSMEQ